MAVLNRDTPSVRMCNEEFKSRAEQLANGNAQNAWKGLNMTMGRNQQKQPLVSDNSSVSANAVNKFYARFDTHDYSSECVKLCQSVDFDPVTLVESNAVNCLTR